VKRGAGFLKRKVERGRLIGVWIDASGLEKPVMRLSIKRPLKLVATAVVLLSLGGCVYYDDPYYYEGYRGGGYYGGGPYGYYDGYYDGYYGPYIGGYWASDGYFYYRDRGHRYYRDHGRHFRRDHFRGGRPFRGERGYRGGRRGGRH